MKLNIRGSQGTNFDIEIADDATVQQLKAEIAAVRSLDATKIRLIYSGKILADNQPLSFYNIADGHAVHMVVAGPKPSAQPAAPSAQPAQPATTAPPSSVPEQPLPQFTPPPQGNPFAGMGGFGGMPGFGGGMPDFNQINQMMQNPMFQQAFDQMLANPELMRSMIENNPMIANNPMLRQQMEMVLNNPEMLRQSMEMLRNLGQNGGDLSAMMQNPEVQAAMNDPQFMQNAMNMMSGAGGNPFAGLFGQQPAAQQPAASTAGTAAPSATATTSAPTSSKDKEIFYKITGLTQSPELDAKLNAPKASRAVRQLIEACRSLRREGVEVFPSVEEIANTAATPAAPAPAPAISNEERFASQLQQMNEMGLNDNDKNIRALLASNGNVNVAIERIFSGFN